MTNVRENLKHIHTTITSQYLDSRKNKVTNTTPYDIHLSEQTLPRHMRTKLAKLRANKSPLLQSYPHIHGTLKLTRNNARYICHVLMTLNTSLTIVKYQHNTTPLVCKKAFRSSRGNPRVEFRLASLGD